MAGRGFGKTRTGAEWVRGLAESGSCGRIALVAPTAADARDVMVEGESGLMAICPNGNRPVYEPSKRRLTWPNGAIATTYSADEPERLRGPQSDSGWLDEIASWRYPDAFDMLMFGMRLGKKPRICITTTPRPTPLVRKLLARRAMVRTGGSTYDNAANLAEDFLQDIKDSYEGTRLGRQELYAELLLDTPGALWTLQGIEDTRVKVVPEMDRVVVAIDPAATANESSDETGIVIAGLGVDGRGYVLGDVSRKASPQGWATAAIDAYHQFSADRIVYESNQGGDMVAHTLRTIDPTIPLKAVHASRGKQTRAEPVAALYEQGKISHIGIFPRLEDQMTSWSPGEDSPDRMDALVWALTELMVGKRRPIEFISL